MNSLERYYDSLTNNVVLRDANGHPSIFVRHAKCLSSVFDPNLPDTVHPAFRCGDAVDDAVLFGKYLPSELTHDGTLYSLPNAAPVVNRTKGDLKTHARAFGNHVSTMTIADYGLLTLMAHKRGAPLFYGNTCFGNDYRYRSKAYALEHAYAVGDIVVFRGYEWQCLTAHTSSLDLLPHNSPTYWEKKDRIGGTPDYDQVNDASTTAYADGGYFQAQTTLTGSGPLDWYLFGDLANEADMSGNQMWDIAGFRLNQGEINIIPNNLVAGDTAVDQSQNSSAWKAILPSNTSDHGYSFVNPGTEGTIRYTIKDGQPVIATSVGTVPSSSRSVVFNTIQVDTSEITYMPYIMYELGLAPLPGTQLQHVLYWDQLNAARHWNAGRAFHNNTRAEMLNTTSFSAGNVDAQKTYYTTVRLRARELAASS